MKTYFVVNFRDGWHMRYESMDQARDGISAVMNNMSDIADTVIEYDIENNPIVEYKTEYTAKLLWTHLISSETQEL